MSSVKSGTESIPHVDRRSQSFGTVSFLHHSHLHRCHEVKGSSSLHSAKANAIPW